MSEAVDVVIPVYQREKLALEAVESVISQSYHPVHLYIIEDGSESLAPYAEKWMASSKETQKTDQESVTIHYHRLEQNKGPSFARNFGASLGSSPYLAFLDSDDLWAFDKIKKQINFLEAHPRYQWIHTGELWLRNGEKAKQKRIHRKEGGRFLTRLFERCLISPSAVMFRRDFFEKSKGFHEAFRIGEDYEFWLRLNIDYPVAYLDEELTIKRAGAWQQLSSTPEMDRARVLALHRFLRLNQKNPRLNPYLGELKKEIIKKTEILYKGALKYNRPERARQYQSWIYLFNKRLT